MSEQHDFWRWMQRLTQGFSAGTVAVTVILGGAAALGETPDGTRQRAAMAAYQAGRWTEAFAGLSTLADGGDADAARLAAMMVRQGPLLFGQRFEASPDRQAAWARLTGVRPPSAARHGAPRTGATLDDGWVPVATLRAETVAAR